MSLIVLVVVSELLLDDAMLSDMLGDTWGVNGCGLRMMARV